MSLDLDVDPATAPQQAATVSYADEPFELMPFVRRWRIPIIGIVAVLGFAFLVAVLGSAPPPRALDPRDASPVGALALTHLLERNGVQVTNVANVDQIDVTDQSTTVVIPAPELLSDDEISAIAMGKNDVLLVAPDPSIVEVFGIDFDDRGVDTGGASHVQPRCDLPAAVAAGSVKVDGVLYRPAGATIGCYPVRHSGDMLLVAQHGTRTITVLGSPALLTNKTLAKDGNAALGINLLDTQSRVAWLIPRLAATAPTSGRKGLFDLLPGRLGWALLQLFVAIVVLALWRARRLGPLVVERLPVVVRATETVEGRARLLQAARARATAARALRTATRDRLARRLGMGSRAERAATIAAIADHVDATSAEIDDVLYGAEPVDDAGLVALAARLDAIEEEVSRR